MTATTAISEAIYIALRNRDTHLVACLINHLATTDPDTAQHIRHAIEHTETRLRAERGALEARDWADYVAEQTTDFWTGAPE